MAELKPKQRYKSFKKGGPKRCQNKKILGGKNGIS
jgi:hypothetical protein